MRADSAFLMTPWPTDHWMAASTVSNCRGMASIALCMSSREASALPSTISTTTRPAREAMPDSRGSAATRMAMAPPRLWPTSTSRR